MPRDHTEHNHVEPRRQRTREQEPQRPDGTSAAHPTAAGITTTGNTFNTIARDSGI